MDEQKKKNNPIVIVALLIVIGAIMAVFIKYEDAMDFSSSPAPKAVVQEPEKKPENKEEEIKKQEEDKQDINDSIARVCAKNYITSALKAPSTADFPWFDWQVKKVEDNKYFVKSYVDSENSFGAKIRTNFVCEVSVTNPAKYECDTKCTTD